MPKCPNCHQEISIGQMELSDHEIRRLPMGNQNTKWNTIRWQTIKGHADFYDVPNWTDKVDPSLSYDENKELMRKHGTSNNSKTVREISAEEKSKQRWRRRR